MTPPIILSIAGSDSSAGAGIQADIKTVASLGGYATTVITTVTAQNTIGVQKTYPLPTDLIRAQIHSILSDINISAVKIGLVPNIETVTVIAEELQHLRVPIIYDPVMISTSGEQFMQENCIEAIKESLFPLCQLITPNIPEAYFLSGIHIDKEETMLSVAESLANHFQTAFLIKGGHLDGELMNDVLYYKGTSRLYVGHKFHTKNLHGTGCTLSSAIATFLAYDTPMPEAIKKAKSYVTRSIKKGKSWNIGNGIGPLSH